MVIYWLCAICAEAGSSSITHLATPFHRQQIILEHFNFHSLDKSASFGHWAHQMYREALCHLSDKLPVFQQKCRELGLKPHNCEVMLKEERRHFTKDFYNPPELTEKLDYAELLLRLWTMEVISKEADAKHVAITKGQGHGYTQQQRTAIQARRNATFARWSVVHEEVCLFEIDHDITEQWTPDGTEYLDALEGLRARSY
ncbi:hypothetical protein AAF712_014065 [Marasmius tenuissimus]|uniref:Uncharacterized protein n=1 Tax=Marasmius tenuissimus TaxID=585030 RepID=A0ABR2ZD02_9AGAR